ncbi:hypothetical protein [Serratia plymuthica]|uniref:hypothetical protein n=1 Tax=Serratia plymuthica TaxID=82996 RepID=UPI000A60CE31|nr:hypothetical protein [Serratia plymuthica]
MSIPELHQIINAMNNKGYIVYDTPDKEWNINIVGVRSSGNDPSKFDDYLFVFYRDGVDWSCHTFNITTDPSIKYLQTPLKEVYDEGTAILKEGQYISAYEINWHKKGSESAHKALCQNLGEVTVYRDNTYDEKMDLIPGTEESGFFGINIHRGPSNGDANTFNWNYSAGCQVFSNNRDFDTFLTLCLNSYRNFGNTFTYTLLNESDLK